MRTPDQLRHLIESQEMVQVHYIQQLGNRLFQYSLGRIIAEALGYALDAAPIEGFPGTAVPVRGCRFDKPVFSYDGHRIPLESILLNPSPRRIVLQGWFQNCRYYAPHAARIRRWLAPTAEHDLLQIEGEDHGEDLLIHVRLTDITPAPLSFDYYRRLIKAIAHRRAYLVTDEPTHPIIAALVAEGVLPLLGAVGALRLGRGFGKLVIGNSTFGWWLAFLSNAREVHVGIPEHYKIGSPSVYRIADGLDLRLDEPKYVYHYRVPLMGESSIGEMIPLGNFCGCHQHSKAFLWRTSADMEVG